MPLDREDIDRLREIFIPREECENKMQAVAVKQSENDVRFALIEQSLKTISWVSKTTLGAVITAIVGIVISLITKGN